MHCQYRNLHPIGIPSGNLGITLEAYQTSYIGTHGPYNSGHGWTCRLLLEGRVQLPCALNRYQDNPDMESLSDRFKAENHSLLLGAVGLQELGDAVTTQMSYYNVAARWGPELGATGSSCREPDSAVLCSPTNRQARWQYDDTPARPPRVQRLCC